ncbi:MAG: type I-U CRISPR-associated helicase/endonuclease Cas3 [Gammaproteobacteria bacterium]|nr:type I-U CRISPR-associated helicase/endonuclease Cas3 [Gammaproteobacteria bacterium]
MTDLHHQDFDTFFRAVYGYPPFPWQSRLARQVLDEGRFPDRLDLPTGSGKTAAIDVAVFALAADLAAGRQRLPCRIAFVVDRRTVADQSFARAIKLANVLADSKPDSVVRRVADQLIRLAGTHEPLHVALLRGAVQRDDTWAANPAQPTVLISTVDQVGSRLFFRGYGVSEGMRPVHAGLLGNDILFMLDEVHLARPFCDTLRMLERYHADRIGSRLPRRFQLVELSATHHEDGAKPFRLDAADLNNGVLRRRLVARKPTNLKMVKVSGGESRRLTVLAEQMAAAAVDAIQPGNAVGVVVNRVQAARLIYADLTARGLAANTWLLTSRMRPLDRQELEKKLQARLTTGRSRDATLDAVVLVSTQCIEAGADFDFDILLTECASLDALRQRFGRLNRAGDLDNAAGTIFARSDIDGDDPIYGTAAAATWNYLCSLQQVDFGSEGLTLPKRNDLVRLLTPVTTSPILLPAHLDAWSQTAPVPYPDPDVALWLHGPRESSAEVRVVWRADLEETELEVAARENANGEKDTPISRALAERLDACPPLTSESLAVPVWAAKGWLLGTDPDSDAALADVERHTPEATKAEQPHGRPALVIRNGEAQAIRSTVIKAWDTVIVPIDYGGIRSGNWDPGAAEPVTDLADAAHLQQRGRAVLRLDSRLWPGSEPPVPIEGDAEQDTDDRGQIRRFLAEHAGNVVAETGIRDIRADAIRILLEELAQRDGPRLIRVKGHQIGDSWVLISRRIIKSANPVTGLVSPDLALDGDELSLIGKAAPLRKHLAGVGRLAEGFARRCGLPEPLVQDLRLAGQLHDLGKHDSRFQCLLHGGSEYRALTAPEALAKSAVSGRNRRQEAEARRRADYPVGTRHELISLALLQDAEHVRAKANDWDLVLYLVASHHGHCRPLAPVEPESVGEPVQIKIELDGAALSASTDHGLAALDSGVSDRFFILTERYGSHGLAWVEAILRLADHRRSEQEERGNL